MSKLTEKLEHLWSIVTRTELWAAVAVIVGALVQANALPESWAKLAAAGLAVLAALGYGVNRTLRKVGRDKAKASVVAADVAANPS